MKLDREYVKLEKELDRLYKEREKELAKNFTKAGLDIKRDLAKLYEQYGLPDGQLDFNQLLKYKRLDRFKDDIAKALIITYKTNDKLTRQILRDTIDNAYKGSIGIVNKAGNYKIKPIIKSHDITKTLNERVAGYKWTERSGMNRAATIQKVEKKIIQGLDSGSSYNQVAKALSKELNIGIKQAATIARTETHRCRSYAKQESYNDIAKHGVKARKKWVTMKDEGVRESHQDLDGQIVGIDEEFTYGGYKTQYPGGFGVPELDIRCRCISVLIIEE